jgi:hypothetical protein
MNRASGTFQDDRDESHSLHSLDLEEAKAMLRDAPEHSAFLEPNRRNHMRAFLYPCSITTNLLLFVFVLMVLGNPCYFSSRTCVYPKAPSEGSQLKLMSEEHGLVPECSTPIFQPSE